MSRLETSAEPSMEEILASIRKIIAEEPPGSRTVPGAAARPSTSSAPASTPKRGFMTRETFMRQPSDADPQLSKPGAAEGPKAATEAKAEPSRASPTLNAHADLNSHADHGSADKTEAAAKLGAQDRVSETSPVEPASKLKDEVEVQSAAATISEAVLTPENVPVDEKAKEAASSANHDAKSIEAQLADLLGDDLQALDGAQHDAHDAGAPDIDPSDGRVEAAHSDFGREDLSRADKQMNGAAEPADGNDPFAFNLGPSPFFIRSERSESQPHIPVESPTESDALHESESGSPFDDERHHTSPGLSSYAPATEPKRPEPSAVPPRSTRASEPFGVPSVAATLGPHRTLEPLSSAFQSSSADHSVFEPHNDRPIEETPPFEAGRSASVRAEFRGERLERILQPVVREESREDSAIEDAVADLLRPLLRTWLAENMPKIIERALRREMSERLLPGKKGPFD